MQVGLLTLVDTYADGLPVGERYRQVCDLACLAEELGFDTFWIGEHHFSRYAVPNPVPLLTAIALRTSRIRLGTGIALAAHHDPIRLAEDYAMLDQASDGRLDLVIARGAFLQGYAGFNQSVESGRDRIAEALEIVRGAWTEAPFSYQGRYRTVDAVTVQPRPVQQPHPPIWLGAGSPESVQITAAQRCHLALPSVFSPPLAFQATVEAFRTAAGDSASDLSVSAGRHTYVAESTEQAEAEWEPHFERYSHFVQGEFEGPWYEGSDMPERVRGWADGPYSDRVRKFALCGSPADVARRTIEMCDGLGGIEHFWGYFDIGDMPTDALVRSVELYAQGVIPRLRDRYG
jgi:alkanesulfonate monooxygenase SsuD/methylene tetrahydromethanopterin reductase-like flavin-dependent oxidoreductase (luciferase family)